MKETKKIIEGLLEQVKRGRVLIGGQWAFYVKLNTIVEGKSDVQQDEHLIVNIPDLDTFAQKVHKYLKVAMDFYRDEQAYFELDEKGFKERLIMFLLINMTRYEGANIEDSIYSYIDQRTKMLQKGIFEGTTRLGQMPYQSGAKTKYARVKSEIKKVRSNLEGPYKMGFYFDNEDGEKFTLPLITFGVCEDTAYVYAVQRESSVQQGRLVKDLDRYFRKLNKNVDAEDVVANVSPNALAALTLFVARMKQMGVKKIIAKDFLPVRYTAIADKPFVGDEERITKLNRDQFNITNKLMYLFLRYNYHFVNCTADYQEYKGEMQMKLEDGPANDDNIIYMLDEFANVEAELDF